MSILLKQVCAFGRFSLGASMTWIVKSRGPAAPVEPIKVNTTSYLREITDFNTHTHTYILGHSINSYLLCVALFRVVCRFVSEPVWIC